MPASDRPRLGGGDPTSGTQPDSRRHEPPVSHGSTRTSHTDSASHTHSDTELLRRCVEGDEGAWQALVARYQALVYSCALEVGLEPEDAGDVFQEVWAELYRSALRIQNPAGLPRWLIVATRRLAYKVASNRRRFIAGISRDLVDPAGTPDEEVAQVEARQRSEAALRLLGGRCESLLRLLFLHSPPLTYEEISERTGLAIGSIGPIRSRCLDRLRRILEEQP